MPIKCVSSYFWAQFPVDFLSCGQIKFISKIINYKQPWLAWRTRSPLVDIYRFFCCNANWVLFPFHGRFWTAWLKIRGSPQNGSFTISGSNWQPKSDGPTWRLTRGSGCTCAFRRASPFSNHLETGPPFCTELIPLPVQRKLFPKKKVN